MAAAAASNCHAGSVRVGTPSLRANGGRAVGDEQLGDVQPLERRRRRRPRALRSSVNCPDARLSHAMPVRCRPGLTATSRLSRLASSRSAVGHRARRDHAQHLALDRSLARRGIADLLADRDRLAELHQLREIAVDGVVRHAGHRDRRAGRLPARGQRDVEQARGALRVVVEELVEIAHPVEQQLVRMLRLGAEVLLHHGRVPGERRGGGVGPWRSPPDYKGGAAARREWRRGRALRHNAGSLPIRLPMPTFTSRSRPTGARRICAASGRSP